MKIIIDNEDTGEYKEVNLEGNDLSLMVRALELRSESFLISEKDRAALKTLIAAIKGGL